MLGLAQVLQQLVEAYADRLVPGSELLSALGCAEHSDFGPTESRGIYERAEQAGVGIEPDARSGGPALSWHRDFVLFRVDPNAPPLSDDYREAAAALATAAVLAACDGTVTVAEERALERRLEAGLHLAEGEKRRLRAHLRWLISLGPRAASLSGRVRGLGLRQRREIGEFMVGVAAADGVIHPNEVGVLLKVFRALGLTDDDLYTYLNALEPAIKREWEVLSDQRAQSPKPRGATRQRRPGAGPAPRREDPTPRRAAGRADVLLELLFAES